MKRIIMKIGILAAVFIIGVVVIAGLMNNETTDNKTDLEAATLPVLAMEIDETLMNRLFGYTKEMQVDFMRDSLTPLDTDKKLTLVIESYDLQVDSVAYEVRTSDGSTVIENAKIKSFEKDGERQKATFTIQNSIRMNQEYSLRFAVETNQGTVYYYTRLLQRSGLNTAEYVQFAEQFYQACLNKQTTLDLTQYLETDASVGNSSFTDVNIHSTVEQVSWGELNPQLYRKAIPTIKDINETTGSISLNYVVSAKDEDGNEEFYQVEEFYRMRYTESKTMLLDFERTATQIFDGNLPVITAEGINLGVTSKDNEYVSSKNAEIVAFVQQGDLWTYNKTANKITKIFSFQEAAVNDERNDNPSHDLKIIRVGETGDVDFVLYGYQNRGAHEGTVGISVYHYSNDQNVLDERFFLPVTVSYEFLKMDLDILSYVSTQDMLYLVLERNLYQFNINDRTYEIIKSDISRDDLVVSNTHAHAAWMEENGDSQTPVITVIDFETGKTRTITPEEGTRIKAIGLINEDIVYGIAKEENIVTDASGEIWFGMNEIRIENFAGELVKNYQQDGIFILNVNIEQGLLELERAVWENDAYVLTSSDHIMNNTQQENGTITISTKITERQGMQVRLNFSQSIANKNPLVLESKLTSNNQIRTLNMDIEREDRQEFYVYARGGLDGIYTDPGEAVMRADEQAGVVLNRAQQYVWERGNLKAKITIDLAGIPEVFKNAVIDETVLTESLQETGTLMKFDVSSLDQVLYQISASRPVIGKISDTEGVLIVGYDSYNTILYRPETGETYYYGLNDSRALFDGGGNVFYSYIENLD